MTTWIIILYFVIGIVVSIIGAYIDYRESCRYGDIDDYLKYDFSSMACIFIAIFWPIVLITVFFMVIIPNLFVATVILLDKFFGGKK